MIAMLYVFNFCFYKLGKNHYKKSLSLRGTRIGKLNRKQDSNEITVYAMLFLCFLKSMFMMFTDNKRSNSL